MNAPDGIHIDWEKQGRIQRILKNISYFILL